MAIAGIQHEVQHYEPVPNKKFARDLVSGSGLFTLMLTLIKDLKNENLHILVSQETVALLESFKANLSDWSRLNEEQLKQIKQSMIDHPGHFLYKKLAAPE